MAYIHGQLAVSAILYMLILGLWGIVRFIRHEPVSPGYRGALAIGEVLLVVQSALGLLLLALGNRPEERLHLLYGTLIPLMLPFAYAVSHGRPGRAPSLMYGSAALFIVGLAIRAVMTGG